MICAGGNMNFKPLFDRVVVDPEIEESVSKGGIVLPQTSQERPQIGVVVAVGDIVKVRVIKIDLDKGKVGLSMKGIN